MANISRRITQGGAEIDPITLTQEMLDSKSVELERAPKQPEEVFLSVIGAGPQFYGEDFIIEGKFVKWVDLGLDQMGLEVGDKLMIVY